MEERDWFDCLKDGSHNIIFYSIILLL